MAGRSTHFGEMLKGAKADTPLEIKSSRPKAFVLITEALMRGQEVDLSKLSLKEVTDLLKEADKYQVTDQIISLDSLDKWLDNSKPEAEDLAWIDLLTWAKKNHHPPIGLRVVERFFGLFEEGKLVEPWASNPAAKNNIREIVTNKNYKHFRILWTEFKGSIRLDLFHFGEYCLPSRWTKR